LTVTHWLHYIGQTATQDSTTSTITQARYNNRV